MTAPECEYGSIAAACLREKGLIALGRKADTIGRWRDSRVPPGRAMPNDFDKASRYAFKLDAPGAWGR